MNGGLAGLVLAILVGKRVGYPKTAMKPFSIILTAAGAALLWFGWYGFNGGSAFGANAIAGLAVLTTTVATAAAGVTWLLLEWFIFKKPTLLGIASGIIAGLVAITPAAGFVSVGGSFIVGIGGSIIAFFQSVVVVGLWTLIGTVIVYYIASALTGGARVVTEDEEIGLDESIHGERGMNL